MIKCRIYNFIYSKDLMHATRIRINCVKMKMLALFRSTESAAGDRILFCCFKGLISKNRTSSLDKDLSGMTLRDLWDSSSNNVNKPLPPPLGLPVARTNVGKGNRLEGEERLRNSREIRLANSRTGCIKRGSWRLTLVLC